MVSCRSNQYLMIYLNSHTTQKARQRLSEDCSLRTFLYIPVIRDGFLCGWSQAEYPYLLVVLAVSTNVLLAVVCAHFRAKEKRSSNSYTLLLVFLG